MLNLTISGSHANYKKYLRPFWIFDDYNQACSKRKRITKAYLLKDDALKTLNDAWKSNAAAEIIDTESGTILTRGDFPANGVMRSSYSSITIRSIIPISLPRIDHLIVTEEAAQRDVYGSGLRYDLQLRRVKALRYLYQARHWVRLLDGLPNLYADHFGTDPTEGNGRLWGIGGFHLQRLPRTARAMLYGGTGWWDFDFRACHASILLSLARAYGLETPWFDDYMSNREQINEWISEDIDVPVWKMKRVMNSTIYGQPLSKSSRSSLLQTLGSGAAVDELKIHLYYRMLRDELKDVIRPAVIAKHLKRKEIVNVVGKVRPLEEEDAKNPGTYKKVPARKLLSHILTGYEAWALNTVCSNQTDLIVLMHDGWLSEQGRDTAALEADIQRQSKAVFGFSLDLQIKSQQFQ
jgi:hypothetical protein